MKHILTELDKLKTFSTEEGPLDATYDRVMRDIYRQPKRLVELALKVLSWIFKAQRTLTLDEIQVAVSVKPNQYELNELDLPDRMMLLDACGSLVTIDEETKIVRLAHHTVQEYLLRYSLIPEVSELELAITCATYLSFNIFSTGASTSPQKCHSRLRSHPFLQYAARHLSHHLSKCDDNSTKDAVFRLLRSPGCISSYLQAFTISSIGSGHTLDMEDIYIFYDLYPKGRLPIHLASSLGNSVVVRLLLLESEMYLSAVDESGYTALHIAASSGNEKLSGCCWRKVLPSRLRTTLEIPHCTMQNPSK